MITEVFPLPGVPVRIKRLTVIEIIHKPTSLSINPTSLTGASVPSLILMGRTITKPPVGGILPRFATFSMIILSAPKKFYEP
jgi:hypothetical protein